MSTEELPPRESMEFDVVIVGAGPSGLAAAIRLKQLNADLTIVVVEKGSEVGAHILSGAVIDPVSLDRLVPNWREDADCPLKTQVKTDKFYWMTQGSAIPLPAIAMPPLMNNHHCYIGSLGNVCRWLATKAEQADTASTTAGRIDCACDVNNAPVSGGCNDANDCIVVPGRICSSLSRMVMPLMSLTGITEFLNRPSSHAFAARCWLCTA